MFKKSMISAALTLAMISTILVGCGSSDTAGESSSISLSWEKIPETATSEAASTEAASTAESSFTLGDDQYISEITGEPISKDIENQRPIAAMVDNDQRALPHFGTADADVVYELMNSTENNRVTRLMCIVKDWEKITQLGSIRSTRPTNLLLAPEWNAVVCHDGGPFYIDQYLAKPYTAHISGVFSRVSNGKAREFTEYIVTGDLDKAFKNAGISTEYNQYLPKKGPHFNFTDYGTTVDLSQKYDKVIPAKEIDLPFPNNKSKLIYNEDTGTYDYYEFGEIHKDGNTGKVMSFKNVLLQNCTFSQLDANGYLIYNCIDTGRAAYYITGGYAKDITWSKGGETNVTQFFDSTGSEIQINTGKTYIALVPSDSWDSMTIN
jgi:hypothetical protein